MLAIEVLGYHVCSTPVPGLPHAAAFDHQSSGFCAAAVVAKTVDVSENGADGRDELYFPELVRLGLLRCCQAVCIVIRCWEAPSTYLPQ